MYQFYLAVSTLSAPSFSFNSVQSLLFSSAVSKALSSAVSKALSSAVFMPLLLVVSWSPTFLIGPLSAKVQELLWYLVPKCSLFLINVGSDFNCLRRHNKQPNTIVLAYYGVTEHV